MSTSIIKDFFDRFGDHFEYNEEEAANSNFYALCEWEDWKRDDPYREEVYAEFKRALVAEFNRKYGVDENDLFVWRLLCERVGILNIPWTVRECRRAIRNTYVNLVDLTEANEGDKVATFKSEQELAAYTRSTGKFFPANHAHAGGLLRKLLRRILSPHFEEQGGYKGQGDGWTRCCSGACNCCDNEY